jgi:hypothetical protein
MTAYEPIEVKEPHRGTKIAGGIVSLASGIIVGVLYVYFFIFCLFFGYIAIIFGEPRYWFLIILIPVALAGAALLVTGGIMGFTNISKTGAILSLLGSGLAIAFNVFLWYGATNASSLHPLISFPFIGLPASLIGLIGGVLLAIALRGG